MSDDFLATLTGDDWPRFGPSQVGNDSATLNVVVHPELTWFRGHFPGHAVLPGVVQVHWAAQWGRGLLGVTGEFTGIDNLKFVRIINPGTALAVTLEYAADRGRLAFHYAGADGRFSSGRIRFA